MPSQPIVLWKLWLLENKLCTVGRNEMGLGMGCNRIWMVSLPPDNLSSHFSISLLLLRPPSYHAAAGADPQCTRAVLVLAPSRSRRPETPATRHTPRLRASLRVGVCCVCFVLLLSVCNKPKQYVCHPLQQIIEVRQSRLSWKIFKGQLTLGTAWL